MASIARKKKIVDLNPKMVPNPVAVAVMGKLLFEVGNAFEDGLIRDAGDWGIVAAHFEAFAHYMDEGGECGARNESFREGLVGDAYRPSLSIALIKGCEEVWNEIAPSFINEQQGQ